MLELDVRGLSCPEPVYKVSEAIKKENALKVLTDCVTAKKNIESFLLPKGFSVNTIEENGEFILEIKK